MEEKYRRVIVAFAARIVDLMQELTNEIDRMMTEDGVHPTQGAVDPLNAPEVVGADKDGDGGYGYTVDPEQKGHAK